MPYKITYLYPQKFWARNDPDTGEDIYEYRPSQATYDSVEDERFEDTLAKVKKDTCDLDSIKVDYIPYSAEQARAKRDKLLADTDWTQTLDAPIDEDTKTAYRAYRQALRDVPQQEGFPETIIWPELPAKVKAAPEPVDEAVDLLLSGATGEEETA